MKDKRAQPERQPTDPIADLAQDGFVSVREAGKFLGLSRAKIYSLMDSGELRYAKFGKSRRVPRRALAEYAQRCIVA
jgi:excisionase family DNA binding protein